MRKQSARVIDLFKIVLFILLGVIISNNSYAQCTVTIAPSDTTVCSGEVIVLNTNESLQDTVLFDQFTMTVTSPFNYNTPSTILGEQYLMVVTGLYGYGGWSSPNCVDAAFAWCGQSGFPNTQVWEWNGSNQTPPTPNTYNPNHIYSFPFTGDGSSQNFQFIDNGGYGDNSGSLNFTIYHIIPGSTASYFWSTGETSASINVNPNQTTSYWVEKTINGTTCTDTMTITVFPSPNINSSVNPVSSQTACNGAIFLSVTGGQNPYSYQWDTSGVNIVGGAVLQSLCENTYCVSITDNNGCNADTCFDVEWNPCNLSASVSVPIDCPGGLAAFLIEIDTLNGTGDSIWNGPRFEYYIYTVNPFFQVGSQFSSLPTWSTLVNAPAGDYVITAIDKSWQDSCYTNITVTEPKPLVIYTTIDSTSASWVNDGSILIDSITGGVGNKTWVWYDSSYVQSSPGTSILFDSLLLDNIYFSHEYYGGYSISVTDANGCTEDTTLYVYPENTLTAFDTAYVNQDETCWGYDDGKLFGSMNDSAVPPFTYYWVDVATADTIRVDCFGCPPPSNYNNLTHVATKTNLAPGCYSLTATDAFGNPSIDYPDLCVEAADSMYVVINPDLDSILLNCSANILLSALAFPSPSVAQLMPDTFVVANNSGDTIFTLDYNLGSANGSTYSLYNFPQRSYYLECTGTLTDNSAPPINYDAGFMDWPGNPIAQNSIWSWNNSSGGTVPLLNSSSYDGLTHTYIWNFTANGNSANQNGTNSNLYDHEFAISTTLLAGTLDCKVYAVVDTIVYDYSWTILPDSFNAISTSDTLLTDSSVIVTTDYLVTVTKNNTCAVYDNIRVSKNLNTLALDSILITPVIPCYGDQTGEIHVDVDGSSAVLPFTYTLYDVDTNFIQSTNDTFFTGLTSGNYVIQVQDAIGCLNPFALVFIDQPDTIFACGVDMMNDTIFDIFTHTVIANDPSTWNFQTGILAPNFQYYLVVDSTFGMYQLQSSPPFDQDAAFNDYDIIVNPNSGPWWTVDGDVLRPDIDIYNPNHTYIYNSPSDVNGLGDTTDYFTGSGNILNFEFFGLNNSSGDTADNQGGLRFRLHKISCTQTDTAFTCKGEGLGFAYVRSQSVNGSLGGIPYSGGYYETAWIKYNPITGATIDTIQGGVGSGASDTIVNLFAGSYKVVVIDSLGCSEFVRYLEVVEPIDTFKTVLDTSINIECYGDNSGLIKVSNYGGFNSNAFNGSSIVPIASNTSRYAVLMKDTLLTGCAAINALAPGNYVDTVITLTGVLDSIVFDNLMAGKYRVFVYDSLPDATYGQFNPLTGDTLTNPFNYMMCPQIIDVFISGPCDSLFSSTTLLSDVTCWGDSAGAFSGRAFVQAIGGNFPYTYQWHNAPFGPNGIGEFGDTVYNLWADTVLNSFPNALWHTVTVTDASGCTREDSIQIKHTNRKIRPFYFDAFLNDTIWDLQFIEDSVSCFGDCNGIVALQSLGGVYPHGYIWETNPLVTIYNQPDTTDGLCAGGHNVIIKDNIGCSDTILFRIDEPTEIFVIGSLVSPITCFGFDDGLANSVGIGGNNLSGLQSAYNYSWTLDSLLYNGDSIVGVNQDLDSIPPGIHIVTITDYKGCTATDTVEFIEPTQLSVIFVDSSTVYAYCENTQSAQLCAQAFGGTPNYVYQLNDVLLQNNTGGALPSGNAFCVNNLMPINTNTIDGTYTIQVIDDRGCFADTTIDIDSITNTFNTNSIITTTTHVSCFGAFDGAISIDSLYMIDSISANGVDTFYHTVYLPNSGYSFTWIGPNGYSQNIQNISSLYAGSYAVYIEDSNGCQRNKNIEVEEPDQLYYNIYTTVDATCVGDGYTNTATIPPSEGSCDGQIMVNITGGIRPYFYDTLQANVWPIPLTNLDTISNDTLIDDLCFGSYTLYITDANGCDGQVSIGGVGYTTIGEGIVVTVPNVDTTITSCSDTADGTAIMLWPAANPLFNYTWETNTAGAPFGFPAGDSPSGTVLGTSTPSFNNFYIGNYWLVAHYSDPANFGLNYDGCDAAQSFTITGPSPIIHNFTMIEPDCWGSIGDGNNGQLSLNPSGGTGPYEYDWDITISLPSGGNSSLYSNLEAGTYGVTVIDANGCTSTDTYTVTQPPQLQNNFSVTDVTCNGLSDGILIPNTSGGTPFNLPSPNDYNYSPNVSSGFAAGLHIITITDSEGCTIEDTAIVNEFDALYIDTFSINNITCYDGNDGEVLAVAKGGTGTGTYSYSWVDASSGAVVGSAATVSGIGVGTYSITVTDNNGCQTDSSITLKEPEELILIFDFEDPKCYNFDDGSIDLSVSGGVQPYEYTWSNGEDSEDIYDLFAGTYSVTVLDNNDCPAPLLSVTLIEPDLFVIDIESDYTGPKHAPFTVNFIDNTDSDDDLYFVWSFEDDTLGAYEAGEEDFDADFEVDDIGLNTVTVVVINEETGCTSDTSFIIAVQGVPDANNVFTPNGDGINDVFLFNEFAINVISVEIYNRWGQLVNNWTEVNKGWNGTGPDGQELPEGVYFFMLTATGEDGQAYSQEGTITLLR